MYIFNIKESNEDIIPPPPPPLKSIKIQDGV